MTTSVGRGFFEHHGTGQFGALQVREHQRVDAEMMESSNAGNIVPQALIDTTAPGLDAVLLCPTL
jgi:hypothetical protein